MSIYSFFFFFCEIAVGLMWSDQVHLLSYPEKMFSITDIEVSTNDVFANSSNGKRKGESI